ncbi:MAG: hypothetical protein QXZ36_06725, partial [Thermoproteota archaeon]
FALAAYVFPPQNVIFDDNIPNGKISTAGLTLSSGSKLQILGANTITALPPGNFVFNNWQISNTVNLTLSNAIANPTTLTVFGSGVVTAIFNGITKFTETGLPTSTKWNVTYDGILNSSTTNTITFSTVPGNYPFSVANQIVSNTIYFPAPSGGSLSAGNATSVTFATRNVLLTFDDSPTLGSITFNGITYANGASNTVLAGVYPINAVVPFGYAFSKWSASNANVTFSNANSANTIATVSGSSVITATYNFILPSSILYYVPITITNSQTSPTPVPFQQMISVNSLAYESYEANNLDNIEFFYANGNVIPSWMEGSASNTLLNNPANSIYMYTSTNTIYWLNIPSGIPASSSITVYMGFASASQNLFNNVNVGEAPQLSPVYAQYDDGVKVFDYYNVNPASTAGWTVAGTAGQTTSAPAGSHYATTNAFYANSARGDYLYTSIPSLTTNEIISYDVYTTGLGNLFFLTNSSGAGQMTRLDSRGGSDYSGLATTSSWTSWAAPSTGLDESPNTWYKYDTVISGTSAYAYIGSVSNMLATYGTVTSSSAFSISNKGNYIGLVGDALGSSYITYWNGMIIRAYPPNGVMPGASFGSVTSTGKPTILIQSNPTNYGSTDTLTASAAISGDAVEILKNGSLIAGPAANTVSYTICDTTPSLGSCWAPGNYVITASDITDGLSSNVILTINKAVPTLTLSKPGNVILSTLANVSYGISTIGNQLTASLVVNGVTVSSTATSNTYSFVPNNGINTLQVTTAGNSNYTAANTIIIKFCAVPKPSAFPAAVAYYVPVCVMNNQSTAASAPFQQIINVTESGYSNYITYNGNVANFEVFNAIGAIEPAWVESNSLGKLVIWVNITSGVAANSITPLYIGFASKTTNLLSSSGTTGIGEIPTASATYGQYDDGAHVFYNYFAGNSLAGWTVASTAGQTTSAPAGSPFGTLAFYANGANGDYLYTTAGGQSANMIVEYYTDEANLDDVYFLVSSSGSGQMGRVGNGAGWYGVASTSSWTSWSAPPDTGYWSNKWLLTSIVVAGGSATMYVSPTPGIYGTEIGQNKSNTYSVANNGNYFGLVGDAASSSTTQYWNGMIIRAYPPNGVMPAFSLGGVYPAQVTCTISLSTTSISFGNINPGFNIPTANAVTDTNTGNANAYMLVYGGNWIGPTQFGVSNTTWSATANTPFSSAARLASTVANTLISVPASGSNSIYFGVGIPGGAPSGSYSQTITIENSC